MKMDMRLIPIRHCQSPSNVGHHLDTGEPGASLTDLGREQAQALPAALAGAGSEAIHASTLRRTQQTTAPLAAAPGLEASIRAGLREISAGTLEMAQDEASLEACLSVVLGWAKGARNTTVPGSREDGTAVPGRYGEVVAEVVAMGIETAVPIPVSLLWTGLRAAGMQRAGRVKPRADAGWRMRPRMAPPPRFRRGTDPEGPERNNISQAPPCLHGIPGPKPGQRFVRACR